jgi:N-acetyl-gamma-glutamyl-phosphate reductase
MQGRLTSHHTLVIIGQAWDLRGVRRKEQSMEPQRIRVMIVNVTGYTGAELARLLARHPMIEVVAVTGRSSAGQRLRATFPHLREIDQQILAEALPEVDVAFLALPHHASAEAAPPLLERGTKVIDISADFRLRDRAIYEQWYGAHPAPDFLPLAVYGLPELHREEIRSARLVGNPGCYPIASILALAPALRAGIVAPRVLIDAKSGVSGAGRTLKLESHFSEVNESVSAYGLEGHRHMPEIAQELRQVAGGEVLVTFIPHLIPMTRGIFATCYGELLQDMTTDQVRALYQEFYAHEPFVRIVETPPATKHVFGSNYCHIYPMVEARSRRLIVLSVIDNLVKGASGQAIQNMNIMMGLPETTGLDTLPIYP